jgi:hypothetical protein
MKRLFLFAGILLSPFFFLAATTQIDWNTQVKNRPTFATVATTGAYSDLTGRPSLWNDPGSGTLLKRTGAFTFAAAVSNTDYQAALGFTPENSANKSAANGYAGLNASSIVPTANLPACVASGASHASGLVPDPGVTAGTTKFLREDCSFQTPPVVADSPSFTAPTLLGTWVNFGAPFATAGYYKSNAGMVFLRGTIKSGTMATAAFTLPSGFRPSATLRFAVDSFGAYGNLDIDSSGNVTPQNGSNGSVNLSGIAFWPI